MDGLVLAPNPARKVHTPHLLFGVRKSQGPERNGKLSLPASISNFALNVPDTVPVIVAPPPVFTHLTFSLGTLRISPENDAIPVVVEGVDNKREVVAFPRTEISGDLSDDKSLLTGRVKTVNSQVEVPIVIQNSDFSTFRGGFSHLWIVLDEIGGDLCKAPCRLVQVSVDDDGGFNVKGGDLSVGVLGQRNLGQEAQ